MDKLSAKTRLLANVFEANKMCITHEELVQLTNLKGFEVTEALREMKSLFMVYKVPSFRSNHLWALTKGKKH